MIELLTALCPEQLKLFLALKHGCSSTYEGTKLSSPPRLANQLTWPEIPVSAFLLLSSMWKWMSQFLGAPFSSNSYCSNSTKFEDNPDNVKIQSRQNVFLKVIPCNRVLANSCVKFFSRKFTGKNRPQCSFCQSSIANLIVNSFSLFFLYLCC